MHKKRHAWSYDAKFGHLRTFCIVATNVRLFFLNINMLFLQQILGKALTTCSGITDIHVPYVCVGEIISLILCLYNLD